jgi:hypothetical protein
MMTAQVCGVAHEDQSDDALATDEFCHDRYTSVPYLLPMIGSYP